MVSKISWKNIHKNNQQQNSYLVLVYILTVSQQEL